MSGSNPRRTCQFQLLRYVPDAVRNEYVHIGVILREQGSQRMEVRFTRDWRRVRCLDPDADTALLEGMESELRRRFEAEPEGDLLRRLSESLSLNVQMTEPKAYLAESLPAGMEELMRIYVEPPPRERSPRLSGRAAIQARMRGEFERQGIWKLMRHNIAVSEYTHRGDPLKIDAAYRPNGTVHMYQALSLEADVNAAKVLAFTFPKLREGVMRAEQAETLLTAIVESDAEREDDERMFALETLAASRIMVATTAELPRIALSVRQQMGLQ